VSRLVLIRHGPTAWTEEGRIQGRGDPGLSVRGRREVATWRLPDALRGAAALTSPLRRARETAALLGLDGARVEPRLAEMDWGDWEGRRTAELRRSLGRQLVEAEARGLDLRPPGGESPRDVQARIRPLLEELAEAGETTVAVAHKGVIRAVLALATGWDMTGPAPAKVRDGCLHEFRLDGAGTPALVAADRPLAGAAESPR
jgi:broad specificity phosphatase PhoE